MCTKKWMNIYVYKGKNNNKEEEKIDYNRISNGFNFK